MRLTTAARTFWRRLACRHEWREWWSSSFDRWWTCDKCGKSI